MITTRIFVSYHDDTYEAKYAHVTARAFWGLGPCIFGMKVYMDGDSDFEEDLDAAIATVRERVITLRNAKRIAREVSK